MSINRVMLSGNITRDPEVRMTASSTPVLSFGLAVNDRRRNSETGEWEDCPNFIDCTMFGTRAESISKHMAKGNKIGRRRQAPLQPVGEGRSAPYQARGYRRGYRAYVPS